MSIFDERLKQLAQDWSFGQLCRNKILFGFTSTKFLLSLFFILLGFFFMWAGREIESRICFGISAGYIPFNVLQKFRG
jgi:uncharacterized membrane protein (DUF485 family)